MIRKTRVIAGVAAILLVSGGASMRFGIDIGAMIAGLLLLYEAKTK